MWGGVTSYAALTCTGGGITSVGSVISSGTQVNLNSDYDYTAYISIYCKDADGNSVKVDSVSLKRSTERDRSSSMYNYGNHTTDYITEQTYNGVIYTKFQVTSYENGETYQYINYGNRSTLTKLTKYNVTLMAIDSGSRLENPVTDISGVPEVGYAGEDLTLTGTVSPEAAADKTIVWSVKDAGSTGAVIEGDALKTIGAGKAVITATVKNGVGIGTDFTKDFTVKILKGDIDSSKTVDNKDAAILMHYLTGSISAREFMQSYNYGQAFVNEDGDIDIRDVVEILKLIDVLSS